MKLRFDQLWKGRSAGLAILALVLFFHLDKILLGPWALVRQHDVFDSDYFRYREMGELLLRHGFFSWFPNMAGGMPAYAWHTAPFFPLALFAAFVPIWLIYHSMVIGLMAAAGWGMFRFLRDRMGLAQERALAGAAFFALASQIGSESIPQLVFNYAFPLFYVWSMEAWENRGSPWRAARPLAGVMAIFLVSHPIVTLPFFGSLHLAVLFLDETLRNKRLAAASWVALLWTGYTLCCLPILYTLYDFAPEVARHFEPSRIPGFGSLASLAGRFGYYLLETLGRTLTFAPLLAAIPWAGGTPRLRRAFVLLVLPLFAAALFSSELSALWAGTLLAKMDLRNFYFAALFPAALAVVLAAEEVFRHPERQRSFWLGIWFALGLLSILTWAGFVSPATLLINLAAATAITLTRFTRRTWRWTAAILFIVVCARVYRAVGDEPERSPYRAVLEDRSFLGALHQESGEPWRAGVISGMPQEVLRSYGWETVDGRSPIFNGRYKEFFRLIVAPQLADPERAEFFDSYWYNLYLNQVRDDEHAQLNLPLLALANVRYLVSADPPLPELIEASEKFRVEKRDSEWIARWEDYVTHVWPWLGRVLKRGFPPKYVVYTLRGAFPRGFLAGRAEILPADGQVLDALSRSSIEKLRSTALFSANDADRESLGPWLIPTAPTGANTSQLISYSPSRLEFHTSLAHPAILVVTNNYHRYWRALIDGNPAPVNRTDHTFQAILLPQPGEHRVELEFRDPGLASTHWGIVLGVLLMLVPMIPRRQSSAA